MHPLVEQLLTVESIATFITTMAGVFVGFLLSAWQYRKQKEKSDNELELKYILLIKKEMKHNQETFKQSYKDINSRLIEIDLLDEGGEIFDNVEQDESKESTVRSIFIGLTQFLESLIEDRALISASNAGSTKAILLDDVIKAYHSYNVAIKKAKQYSDNMQRGLRYSSTNGLAFHLELLQILRSYCNELQDIYQDGIDRLEELENTLKDD